MVTGRLLGRETRSSCRRGAMVAVTQAIVVLVAAAYDRL
jgi:hypothetical protein